MLGVFTAVGKLPALILVWKFMKISFQLCQSRVYQLSLRFGFVARIGEEAGLEMSPGFEIPGSQSGVAGKIP